MTDNQEKLLAFVADFRQQNGVGPSFREIEKSINVSSVRSVHLIVEALIKKDYLMNNNQKFRSLSLTDLGREKLRTNHVPLIFGKKMAPYQMNLFSYPVNGAAVLSKTQERFYDSRHSIVTDGTVSDMGLPIDCLSSGNDTKVLADNGTSKKQQPCISLQNSTINFPLSSFRWNDLHPVARQQDYVIPAAVSFALISIFDKGIVWFMVLVMSILATRKLNKFLKE